MFRSLFSRLMVTYFIIILVTIIVLGVLLSSFFQDYIFSRRAEELIREGEALSPYVELYALGHIDGRTLQNYFRVIDRFLNTTIWITDELGYIWRTYSADAEAAERWHDQRVTVEEFVQVIQGKSITRIGRFNEEFPVPVLTVGVPLRISSRIRGAIFLHSPIQELTSTLKVIYRNIWMAALFSSGVSILLLYFISKRISKPLVEINQISREIALGNFRRRVKALSRDDLGQLGVSFNAMADALENLEGMRRSFVANVSHELRSPLTSIRGYIQGVLDQTIAQAEQGRYLSVALEESERLNRLINELLDLTQIESGRLPISPEVLDLNELIRRVLISMEEPIEHKGMDVDVNFREDPCWVEADRDRLQQVLINLLDNGVKFNRPQGTLFIETWPHKDKVFVKVMDQGPGMLKEEIIHIWEPFYQVDKSRSKKEGGTGLGLSIVKKIIEAHDQSIWVNSHPGEGTAFIFSLKLTKKHA